MRITILGCGPSGGVPSIGSAEEGGYWGQCDPTETKNVRSRASIVIEDDDETRILVDCGPDLRTQLLRAGMARFDGLIVTHAHADHIGGFDDVRGINRTIDGPLPLYATEETIAALEERFPYAFKPWTGGVIFRPIPDAHIVDMPGRFKIMDTVVEVFPQRHYRIETLGLRIRNFAYSTDVEYLSEDSLAAIGGVDTWVVGCLQMESHIAHACLDDVLRWRDVVKPRRTILTHLGPGMDYTELRRILPNGIEPAFDGMILNL